MVVKKKKTTKKQTRSKATKTKVVYRTRTVVKEVPAKETYQSPFGTMQRDTSALIGTGMQAIIGIGVAKGISKALE